MEARGDPPQATVVAVAKAKHEDLSRHLVLTAEFRPYQEIDVHAKVSGRRSRQRGTASGRPRDSRDAGRSHPGGGSTKAKSGGGGARTRRAGAFAIVPRSLAPVVQPPGLSYQAAPEPGGSTGDR